MRTCNHCGDTFPDFDVAHVCSKGQYAPKLPAPPSRESVQPVAEVVAHLRGEHIGMVMIRSSEYLLLGTKLYTAPPSREWHGLTDDEIWLNTREINRDESGWAILFARAIEAALRAKNSGGQA